MILGILLTVVALDGLVLSSTIVSADNDSAVDVINITVPVSCTLAGTGMTSHNATISNGLYTADIGSTILHAFCNDNNGLAIYAAGFTGDEVGGTNSNKLVGTATQSNFAIVTGLATTTSNPDVSNWAMKLTVTQDSGDTTGTNAFTIDSAPNVENPSQAEQGATNASFTQYHVVPNEYVKVAHKNSGTDMTNNTGGIKLTTTYAAYISKTQPADTYSGQVIYTLVHPSSHAAPVYLNPNADNISEVNYMQQFAIVSDANRQAIIDSMTVGQQYTLADIRDGKTYTVAKLQTGIDSVTSDPIYAVWMTKNLDLDLDSARTYTNEDTDIGYNTTTGTYDTASWTPTRSTYQTAPNQTREWCVGGTKESVVGFCLSNDAPESYDPGNLYWNLSESDYSDWVDYTSECDFLASTPTCDQSLNPLSTYTSSNGTAQYHLGNYYNWAAAVASNDVSVYEEELVEQSICPAGWTLPRGGSGDDTFYALWSQYGYDDNDGFSDVSTLWSSPLYFALSGYFDNTLADIGYDGGYWSSTAGIDNYALSSYFDTENYTDPSNNSVGRGSGVSIRCVARPVADDGSGGGGGPK